MNADNVGVFAVAGGLVVRLDGEIDLVVADRMETEIIGRVDGDPAALLVLDLSGVSFLDSAGVRLVDRIVGRYEQRGGTVRVVAPPGSASQFTLDLCRFRPDLLAVSLPDALGPAGG